VPTWSPPYGQRRRLGTIRAADERPGSIAGSGHATALGPALRRLLSLCCSVKAFSPCWPGLRTFLRAPTILAWDWPAAGRNLLLEAISP
jgi:hypothetical protein